MRLKTILYVFLLTFISACTPNQELTTIILVRHAEKAGQESDKDPPLTLQGSIRAQLLGNILKDTEIDAIYTTSFKRTQETADPVSILHNIEIGQYEVNDLGLVDRLLKVHQGQTILVVGHSNTIPSYLNQLLGEPKYEDIPSYQYNDLFIVTALGKGNVKISHLQYGEGE